MKRAIKMSANDTVATALVDIRKGDDADLYTSENIPIGKIAALQEIPFGNKIALSDIDAGERIIKYGAVIGECTHRIRKGELVHVHNVKSLAVDIPPSFKKEIMRQMNIDVREGRLR